VVESRQLSQVVGSGVTLTLVDEVGGGSDRGERDHLPGEAAARVLEEASP
jgi:hypothetical protein